MALLLLITARRLLLGQENKRESPQALPAAAEDLMNHTQSSGQFHIAVFPSPPRLRVSPVLSLTLVLVQSYIPDTGSLNSAS